VHAGGSRWLVIDLGVPEGATCMKVTKQADCRSRLEFPAGIGKRS
jgi:hypothetical protein